MPNQAIFSHHGMRVQSTSAPKKPNQAVMVSAPEFGIELTREKAESLITLLSMALDLTGPRAGCAGVCSSAGGLSMSTHRRHLITRKSDNFFWCGMFGFQANSTEAQTFDSLHAAYRETVTIMGAKCDQLTVEPADWYQREVVL